MLQFPSPNLVLFCIALLIVIWGGITWASPFKITLIMENKIDKTQHLIKKYNKFELIK